MTVKGCITPLLLLNKFMEIKMENGNDNTPKVINGEQHELIGIKPKIQQIIDCGAIIWMDDFVTDNGVLLIHPQLPPIKLYLKTDLENHTISHMHLEVVKAKHGDQTEFAVNVVDAESGSVIIKPDGVN